jgi:hypothetical protein
MLTLATQVVSLLSRSCALTQYLVPQLQRLKAGTEKAIKYADTFVPATSNLIVAAFETFGRFGQS